MLRNLSLALLVLSAAFSNLQAQSLYNFKYSFNADGHTEYYNAFMVRYDDGTGLIRVQFIDSTTGEHYLVAMEMSESYEAENEHAAVKDSNLLFFTGFNPVVISGDTSEGYDPDIYVFAKDEASGYYDPLKVFSYSNDENNDELAEGDFTDVRLLEAEDLTEEFVGQFFFKEEDFYKDLFSTSVRQLTADEKKTTLHLLIVANTNDPDIGSTCNLDKDRTLKTFTDLSEFMHLKLNAKTISGNDYSKKSVEDALSAIQPSPRDIVIFYYSGHGFSKNDNYQYPYLELRSKSFESLDEHSINVEDIYNFLKQKKANVTLVISDCCNSAPETAPAISGELALTRSSSLGWNLNNCFQLFLPPAPIAMLATAATKGEMSAGNNSYGGFFTSNLRSTLVNYLSPVFSFKAVSWDKLIDEAKVQTAKKANGTLCNLPDGTRKRCVQHPVYKMF
ncbi:caspase family protein [Foetidibacter luteolus]|uniref:caspase family protein n=1 Tax=Foetidibacter luteolus TaxID=2608880 RepID=UPI00129A5F52|nr:caspase family protein [Foetidibacter luteolus]